MSRPVRFRSRVGARAVVAALDAPLTIVSDGVAATADGWFMLADGSAVIGPDDVLVVGEQFTVRTVSW